MNYEWSEKDGKTRKAVSGWLGSEECPDAAGLETGDEGTAREAFVSFRSGLETIAPAGDATSDWDAFARDFEVARFSASLALGLAADRLYRGLHERFGTGGTPDDAVCAVAFNDPGDDHPSVTLAARGDGFVMKGSKPFVANGPIADRIAVFADLGGERHLCFVDTEQGGVDKGPRLEMMGLDGLSVCGIAFHQTPIAASETIGPLSDVDAGSWYSLRWDLSLADACAGLMHRTLREATSFAGAHKRGGEPIISHQEVRFQLAEMLTLTQTAELLNRRARWMLSKGGHEAGTLVSAARVFGGENAQVVASSAMQVTAGSGYVSGGVCERAFRDAKGLAIAGTSMELSRMAIADELLERY